MNIEIGRLIFQPNRQLDIWPFENNRPWWEDFLLVQQRCAEVTKNRPLPPKKEWDRFLDLLLLPILRQEKLEPDDLRENLAKMPTISTVVDELDIPFDQPAGIAVLVGVVIGIGIGWVAHEIWDYYNP